MTGMTDEKRRFGTGIDADHCVDQVNEGGVGARQVDPHTTVGGGGYLSTCTILEFRASAHASDPRIDELRAMGMRKIWLDVAEIVGFDAFLAMWRRFEAEPGAITDDGRLELRLRSYRSYLRFQRNRFIASLHDAGLDDRAIQEKVKVSLRESLSLSHISTVANKR